MSDLARANTTITGAFRWTQPAKEDGMLYFTPLSPRPIADPSSRYDSTSFESNQLTFWKLNRFNHDSCDFPRNWINSTNDQVVFPGVNWIWFMTQRIMIRLMIQLWVQRTLENGFTLFVLKRPFQSLIHLNGASSIRIIFYFNSNIVGSPNAWLKCFSQELISIQLITQSAFENFDLNQPTTQARNHSTQISSWINSE